MYGNALKSVSLDIMGKTPKVAEKISFPMVYGCHSHIFSQSQKFLPCMISTRTSFASSNVPVCYPDNGVLNSRAVFRRGNENFMHLHYPPRLSRKNVEKSRGARAKPKSKFPTLLAHIQGQPVTSSCTYIES